MCDLFGWRIFRETSDSRIPRFPQRFRFRNVSDLSRCEMRMEWNLEGRHVDNTWFFSYRDKIGGKFRAISHLHLQKKKVKAISRHVNRIHIVNRVPSGETALQLVSSWEETDFFFFSSLGNRTAFLFFSTSQIFLFGFFFFFNLLKGVGFYTQLTHARWRRYKYNSHIYKVMETYPWDEENKHNSHIWGNKTHKLTYAKEKENRDFSPQISNLF